MPEQSQLLARARGQPGGLQLPSLQTFDLAWGVVLQGLQFCSSRLGTMLQDSLGTAARNGGCFLQAMYVHVWAHQCARILCPVPPL